MKAGDVLLHEAQEVLTATSRTFVIPISRLEGDLRLAVMGAYLCMRSIDEIEDHPRLLTDVKIKLLRSIGKHILDEGSSISSLLDSYVEILPEVTLRIDDWIHIIPQEVSSTVRFYISKMAIGMASWAERKWSVRTVDDLDDYTYVVAGLVGELLNNLWKWHDGIDTNVKLAISFGRGLQAVNIVRNQSEDIDRGVSFFPNDWSQEKMIDYAKKQLHEADEYIKSIESKHIYEFCSIPLALAHATLQAIESDHKKLKRHEVIEIVNEIIQS